MNKLKAVILAAGKGTRMKQVSLQDSATRELQIRTIPTSLSKHLKLSPS
jgi:CTP:molybdopterin cytidylyltransferase MocA